MSNSGKTSTSFNLTDENHEWLERQTDNRSAFLNDLLERARETGLTSDLVLRHQITELELELEMHEKKADATRNLIEDLEENVESKERKKEDLYQEAYNHLHEYVSDHDPDEPRLYEFERYLKHYGQKLGLTMDELEAKIRDDLNTS